MTTTPAQPSRPQPERTFETEIANQVGIIRSNLEAILDRNPAAPPGLRAALARVIGKCMPLTDGEHLHRLRAAYEPTMTVDVRFTEATDQPTRVPATEATR